MLLSTGALLLTLLLPEAAFISWGWRIPFLFSAVLVAIGLIGRARLTETAEFASYRRGMVWSIFRYAAASRKSRRLAA
ncbi:hypothetical protein [Paraburkholderia strydomiana]|uniref:hypothetical protein n=1 Tax=Paraburkholderia strydomiana TaxID=1245417 RepID=UPI002857757C|nr:hypothetical protein [Paraburkholderia strydomiana]MDR7006183.1 hypothetical protein [Paraburkholderia strydomiana]